MRGGDSLRVQIAPASRGGLGETAAATERLEQYLDRLGRRCSERAFVQYEDGRTRSFADKSYGSSSINPAQEVPSALTKADAAGAWALEEHQQALHLASPAAASTWRCSSTGVDTSSSAIRPAQRVLHYAPVASFSGAANESPGRPVAVDFAYETLVTASSAARSTSPERQWRILGCASPASPVQRSPPNNAHHAQQVRRSPPHMHASATVPSLHQGASPLVHPLVSRYVTSFRSSSPTNWEARRREGRSSPSRSSPSRRSPSPRSGGSPPPLSSKPSMGPPPPPGHWQPLSVRDHAALEARAEALMAHLEHLIQARVEALWRDCTGDSCRHVLDESVDLNRLRAELKEGAQAEEPGRRAEALRSKMAALREAERALFAEIVDAELFVGKRR